MRHAIEIVGVAVLVALAVQMHGVGATAQSSDVDGCGAPVFRLHVQPWPGFEFEPMGPAGPATSFVPPKSSVWMVEPIRGDRKAILEALRELDPPGIVLPSWADRSFLETLAVGKRLQRVDASNLRPRGLPALAVLPGIRCLHLPSGVSAEQLASVLRERTPLRELWLDAYTEKSALAGLESLTALEAVVLPKHITDHDLERLVKRNPGLQGIDLGACKDVTDFTPLKSLETIRWIVLPETAGDDMLRLLSRHAGTLEVLRCPRARSGRYTDPTLLAPFVHLRILDIEVKPLKSIAFLEPLSRLECLDLGELDLSWDEAAFPALPRLRRLRLKGPVWSEDLEFLRPSNNLESVAILSAMDVRDLSVLAGLKQLRTVALGDCFRLRDLSPLEELSSLRSLEVNALDDGKGDGLTYLVPLGRMPWLEVLSIRAHRAKDFRFLIHLKNLRSLSLVNCRHFVDAGLLAGLNRLESLDLSDCSSLSNLGPLAHLDRLEWLRLDGCVNVKDIAPLFGLKKLGVLMLLIGQDERAPPVDPEQVKAFRRAHPACPVMFVPPEPSNSGAGKKEDTQGSGSR